jgi:hypothetical protein
MEMAINHNSTGRKLMTKRGVVLMILGFFLGGFTSYGLVRLAELVHVSAKSFAWPDWLAFWLGCTFLGIGSVTYAMTYNRRELARQLDGESEPMPATNEEVHQFRIQGVVLALAGVMLLVPLFAMGAWSKTAHGPEMAMAAIAVLFVLQTIGNVQCWRACDEFQRGMMLRTSAITFGIGQGALFLWAAAEHLRLVPAITSWEIVTLLLALYLGTGCVVAVRSRM